MTPVAWNYGPDGCFTSPAYRASGGILDDLFGGDEAVDGLSRAAQSVAQNVAQNAGRPIIDSLGQTAQGVGDRLVGSLEQAVQRQGDRFGETLQNRANQVLEPQVNKVMNTALVAGGVVVALALAAAVAVVIAAQEPPPVPPLRRY